MTKKRESLGKKQKKRAAWFSRGPLDFTGAPGGIRTPGPLLRRYKKALQPFFRLALFSCFSWEKGRMAFPEIQLKSSVIECLVYKNYTERPAVLQLNS